MGPRYQVSTSNVEHSCCYEATVIDTTQLIQYGKYPRIMAECQDEADAQMISDALNRSAML